MPSPDNLSLSLPQGIADRLSKAVEGDPKWTSYLQQFDSEKNRVHLAIMIEPYLRLCLEGKKTIESRFSTRKIAPYHRIRAGDVMLLKRTGGPVVGICEVADSWFYELDSTSWRMIKTGYLKEIHADSDFWMEHESAAYATLIRVRNARSVDPIDLLKRDRRAWVVLTHEEHYRVSVKQTT
jgi:hypothetical protein